MPRIRIIRKHPLFTIKPLKSLIMSYMQYEDAIKVYEFFKIPEPDRPLANNFTDLFNFLTPQSPIDEIYIPSTYEGQLNLLDLYEANTIRVAYHKFIHKQCGHCGTYNKLNFTFTRVECQHGHGNVHLCRCSNLYNNTILSKPSAIKVYLVAKQLYNHMWGGSGRIFLCDCAHAKRSGSYSINPVTIQSEEGINELINENFHFLASPQRH